MWMKVAPTTKKLNLRLMLGSVFCLALLSTHAFGAISAKVDRSKISIDDTLTLIITSTKGSMLNPPDLSGLQKDFEVLSQSRKSQVSIANGKSTATMQWHIALAPKREGGLVIPPVEIEGEQSSPLVVEVVKSKFEERSGGFKPVFIESELSADEVYVQSQLLLTVKVFYGVVLHRGDQLSPLEVEGAAVSEINETQYETRVNNMPYVVREKTYAIFPQRSGTLTIPAQQYDAMMSTGQRRSLFDSFGGAMGKPVRVHSKALEVNVLPRADEFSGQHWLPAQNIELIESWSDDETALEAGKPITRSVFIEARGQQASQLPPLDLARLDGAQQYADQPETSDEHTASGVIGTRIEAEAIIPTHGGDLVVPAVRLKWWNTTLNREEEAVLPAQTLTVSGAPAPPNTAPSEEDTDTAETSSSVVENEPSTNEDAQAQGLGNIWKPIALIAALGWLVTLALLIFRKRPATTKSVGEKTDTRPSNHSLKAFIAASNAGNAAETKRLLIEWASEDGENISSLAALGAKHDSRELKEQLNLLDAHLYRDGAAPDYTRLTAIVEALNEARRSAKTAKGPSLEPLYKA